MRLSHKSPFVVLLDKNVAAAATEAAATSLIKRQQAAVIPA